MIIFLCVIGVLGVAASGPIMAATAAPALVIAFWRNAFGALLMGGPAVMNRRSEFRALKREDYRRLTIAAVALALHFACFISALKLTSVAAATALVCVQVAWVALFSAFRGDRPAPSVVAGLAVALAGVVVITGFDLTLSAEALLGDVLAVAGGAFAAVYMIVGAELRRTLSTGTYTTLCFGGCAAVLLVMCVMFGQSLVDFPPIAWVGIVGVTIVAQLIGHAVFNHLLAVISPLVVSMVILLEIPGATILAAVFLGEQLPAGTYAGLALILAGLAVVVRGQARRRRASVLPADAAQPPALGGS